MNPAGTVIADWILTARRALARGAAQQLDDASATPDRVQLFADHIDHLAAALAVGRAELFEEHVAWCRSLRALAGEDTPDPGADVNQQLQALRRELVAAVPDTARASVTSILERGAAIARAKPPATASLMPQTGPHVDLPLLYLHAILDSNAQDACALVLGAIDDGADGPTLLREVVEPVQYELGRLWQTGATDVATEHLGSRVAERLAILIHSRAPRRARRGETVVVCAVGSNQHDLAARLLADALERAGFATLFLGADTPPLEVARAAFHQKARAVALSVTLGTQVRIAELTVRALRSLPETKDTKVIVGGPPFTHIEGLWRDIGADASAPDVDHAVTTITAILGGPAA